MLANGDFEAGATIWTATSNHGRKVIRTTLENGVTSHGGSYAAWMGQLELDTSPANGDVAHSLMAIRAKAGSVTQPAQLGGADALGGSCIRVNTWVLPADDDIPQVTDPVIYLPIVVR